MADKRKQATEKDDERLAIPLDPQEALRALLKVDPESEPTKEPVVNKGSRTAS